MGIFGALTTAVTGMRAQAFSLENISGNIANSQTTAFKRIDTSFQDLIPDNPPNKQLAGSVVASSRATNTVQGDVQAASISTFMAINGDGFFIIQKPDSFVDGNPVFAGINMYTRRGDFQPNKDGYLVNGAGYYLMGIPVDSTTGNLVGSVPTLLRFQNDFLPAQATTQIEYRANLSRVPTAVNSYDPNVPNSELLNPATFSANPVAGPPQVARITGINATVAPDAAAMVTGAQNLPATMTNAGSFTINGVNVTITAGMTPAQVATAVNTALSTNVPPIPISASVATGALVLTGADADTNIMIAGSPPPALMTELGLAIGTTNATNLLTQGKVAAGQTLTITIGANPPFVVTFGTNGAAVPPEVSTLAELSTRLAALPPGHGSATVNATNGNITITAATMTDTIAVGGTSTPSNFGIQILTALPSNGTVVGSDNTQFINQSVGGGAITAYDVSGSPVNIQMRWAKVDSMQAGGVDTWNLFYQENASATGSQVAWRNAGVDYQFGANGQMSPLVANVALNNVVVDGISLGTVQIVHGAGGITQFSDANGGVQVNLLQQNGFSAGTLQSVSVSDKGRVVGSYSNGRTIDLAEITLANFNNANGLKRLDGGAFELTDDSGAAILGAPGKIIGSSLEGANTDIADEFTKLIVTQQAYSANTRVITTTNQMVQDLLNMLR